MSQSHLEPPPPAICPILEPVGSLAPLWQVADAWRQLVKAENCGQTVGETVSRRIKIQRQVCKQFSCVWSSGHSLHQFNFK